MRERNRLLDKLTDGALLLLLLLTILRALLVLL
jgi:hypothetical protein